MHDLIIRNAHIVDGTGAPPFDDQDTLVATLLHIWTTALYEDTSTP